MTPDQLRDRAVDAVGQALNASRYWLPVEGQTAVAEAVLALAAAELDAGYCPDCGRGDAGPTADEYEQQRRRADTAEAKLAALHEGEEPAFDEYTVSTPAQWIWRWNRATPEQRLGMAARVLQAFDDASRCVMQAHRSQVEEGRAARAALGRVHALAEQLEGTHVHGGVADGYYEAARRIRAALDPQEGPK